MFKKVFTTGVYYTNESLFFDRLIENEVDLFIDIRMRRGMRGKRYNYVNSIYLQNKLNNLKIDYMYLKELAPTEDIRNLQKIADKISLEKKSSRKLLSPEYIKNYQKMILNLFDVEYFINRLHDDVENIVFFCVEKEPFACHRSLVSSFIGEKFNVEVKHL